jgi:hypothetical protein
LELNGFRLRYPSWDSGFMPGLRGIPLVPAGATRQSRNRIMDASLHRAWNHGRNCRVEENGETRITRLPHGVPDASTSGSPALPVAATSKLGC